MKKISIILVIAMLATPLQAVAKWDNTDKALFATYTTLHTIDWLQTSDMLSRPHVQHNIDGTWEKNEEENPLLGVRPSQREINLYFATTLLMQWLLADKLEGKARKGWLLGSITFEAYITRRNRRRGFRMRIPF